MDTNGGAYNPSSYSGNTAPSASASMTYLCAECGYHNQIKPREPIRCFECGYRILLKVRTKRMTQFEAR
ncbi:DNA-directed RNA polymerase core subunit rpc10 [Coemansia sp. RSA 376]|nr:DNA-directed RNA polymerase core subunit rpc10 [Coemansia sp. S155-1]KAJ2263560.1 DNA-directed RNA polymerase core subunit rpc10 [Coemansia sp. RSA 376]